MERILVSINSQEVPTGAVYRAIHLAIRIKAAVYILQISNLGRDSPGKEARRQFDSTAKEMLDSMIELARSEGVTVNRYVTQGDYMEEVVKFVKQENITLLVLGFPEKGSKARWDFSKSTLEGILKRVDCAVELVQQKAPLFMSGEPQ